MESNTALLVMDMQAAILRNLHETGTLISSTKKAIEKAHQQKIPVIYVVVGFRKGTPEINPNNKGFAASRERFADISPEDFLKIEPTIAPADEDIVVTKRRVSAFTGSDLEVILRSQNIRHILLSGVATSGVVLSTLREAADKDYQITVLADCCADGDAGVHQVLINKVFPRQAEVMTVEEWMKG